MENRERGTDAVVQAGRRHEIGPVQEVVRSAQEELHTLLRNQRPPK